jgi:hypothetical protein
MSYPSLLEASYTACLLVSLKKKKRKAQKKCDAFFDAFCDAFFFSVSA